MSATDPIPIAERSFPDGLRALAGLLDANPGLVPEWEHFNHTLVCWTREELLDACRTLGGRWEKKENSEYFGLRRDLGGGVSIEAFVSREEVCERVQTGIETVLVPADDAPMVEVERPVYGWRCPPSILAEVQS